jgi:hypothetical protein
MIETRTQSPRTVRSRRLRTSRGVWDCAIGSCLAIAAVLHPWTVAAASGIGSAGIAVYRNLRDSAIALVALGIPARAFIVLFIVAFVTFDAIEPAQAQFFGDAQSWMESSFEVDAQLTELVFNVLRALFIIYIAISLVKVVYAVRQDEDWQSTARTPLIVVITITIADVLTQVITGDGGT